MFNVNKFDVESTTHHISGAENGERRQNKINSNSATLVTVTPAHRALLACIVCWLCCRRGNACEAGYAIWRVGKASVGRWKNMSRSTIG